MMWQQIKVFPPPSTWQLGIDPFRRRVAITETAARAAAGATFSPPVSSFVKTSVYLCHIRY